MVLLRGEKDLIHSKNSIDPIGQCKVPNYYISLLLMMLIMLLIHVLGSSQVQEFKKKSKESLPAGKRNQMVNQEFHKYECLHNYIWPTLQTHTTDLEF